MAAGYHHALAFTIPEPHTLLLASLASLGLTLRRRRSARLAICFERFASEKIYHFSTEEKKLNEASYQKVFFGHEIYSSNAGANCCVRVNESHPLFFKTSIATIVFRT
ncbi:MAG: hypothetical protein CMJ72_15555 [Planctomycetaceae bacterium]|nr:hypothetical protein [Planctomycetaceae bacterium]